MPLANFTFLKKRLLATLTLWRRDELYTCLSQEINGGCECVCRDLSVQVTVVRLLKVNVCEASVDPVVNGQLYQKNLNLMTLYCKRFFLNKYLHEYSFRTRTFKLAFRDGLRSAAHFGRLFPL